MRRTHRHHNFTFGDDDPPNNNNDEPSTLISSLSPLCWSSSDPSLESAQFSIDIIDTISGNSSPSNDDGSDGDIIMDRIGDGDQSADGTSQGAHNMNINRPSNPPPISSSSSSSRLAKRRTKPSSSSASSSSSSVSLVQALLRTSKFQSDRHYAYSQNRPPSRIYLPRNIPYQRGNSSSTLHIIDQQSHLEQHQHPYPPNTNTAPPSQEYQYELIHTQLITEIKRLQTTKHNIQSSINELTTKIKAERSNMIRSLAECGGDAKNEVFVATVDTLKGLRNEYQKLVCDLNEVERTLEWRWKGLEELCNEFPTLDNTTQNESPSFEKEGVIPAASTTTHTKANLEGQWFTLTKPTYLNCLGYNNEGNPMYTLGRMSFEMFRPSDLVVSIEAIFNPIMEVVDSSNVVTEMLTVPKTLQTEVQHILEDKTTSAADQMSALRTYHIITAFNIEPYSPAFGESSPNRHIQSPIRGIMTTYGYTLPDPNHSDRYSVWFTGGKVECGEPKSSSKFRVWKKIFGCQQPARTFREGMMTTAAKLLMGASGYNDGMDKETGTMKYSFSRPMGGHGKAYVDICHLDAQNRVMRGHAGTIYVFARMGE